mgnify:CR=1 FL=1
MSPFFIEPNPAEPMRARIAQYSDVCQELAARHDALFVDLQAAFDRILDHWHPSALAWDRIHPSQIGHMAIAKAFLNAIDFAW